ncbi:MAG: hypothetical protein IPI54_03770 [Chitinophagaceae bacterium]|nr:hypothetical protein [Chitinophagaceae bacterium]
MNALIKIIGCCIITLFPVLCDAQNTTNANIILTDTLCYPATVHLKFV